MIGGGEEGSLHPVHGHVSRFSNFFLDLGQFSSKSFHQGSFEGGGHLLWTMSTITLIPR